MESSLLIVVVFFSTMTVVAGDCTGRCATAGTTPGDCLCDDTCGNLVCDKPGMDTANCCSNFYSKCTSCPAPVDGVWGPWGAWGSCSVTCGSGTQTRTRQCNHPAPVNYGADCVGSNTETTACSLSQCPIAATCQQVYYEICIPQNYTWCSVEIPTKTCSTAGQKCCSALAVCEPNVNTRCVSPDRCQEDKGFIDHNYRCESSPAGYVCCKNSSSHISQLTGVLASLLFLAVRFVCGH